MEKGTVILKGNVLNIRKEANINSPVVGYLHFGDVIKIILEKNNFYYVGEGYVSKDYVILNSYTTNGDWQNGLPSIEGFRFLKGFEGYSEKQYQDAGGYWTIGYGVCKNFNQELYNHLLENNNEEIASKVSLWLKINNYGKPIVNACKALGVTKQCQFDAILDLVFNCGCSCITSDNELTRAIKRDINDEAYIRPIWERTKVTSNGKYLKGLALRRKAECDIFFKNVYEKRAICNIIDGRIKGSLHGNGWLYYVVPNEEVIVKKGFATVNIKIGLPLRENRSYVEEEIYFLIPNGREVKIIETIGNWCRIEYLNYVGYVSKAYLKF